MCTLGVLYIALPLLGVLEASSTNDAPFVITSSGMIYGKRVEFQSSPVDVYLGIPYAKPPLDNLKYQKTHAVEPWSQPVYATKQPPACPQYTRVYVPWYDSKPGQSEDCLYLNIWVPKKCFSEPLTVMYWIHGGGYYIGSVRLPVYNEEALATIGNVIVVTVNYRLGALGFLYSESHEAPGNMALYDILEGLKWIHSNIEAFGGDKNSITLFGQSVGAVTAGLFTISPLARGLFKRAIMESFPMRKISDEGNASNLVTSQNLAKEVRCANDTFTINDHPKDVVNCMKRKDGSDLAHALYNIKPGNPRLFITQQWDDLLPESSIEAIRESRFHKTELMIGVDSNDGIIILAALFPELFGYHVEKDPKINKTLAETLVRKAPLFPDPDFIIHYYLSDVGEYEYDKIEERLISAASDIEIICGSFSFADKFADIGSVYFYYFTHRPSDSHLGLKVDATHFDEVEFVFGKPLIYPRKYPRSERRLSESMIRRWTTFAKHGYPDKDWPLYSERNPIYKILNTTFPSGIGESNERTKKFCDMYKKMYGF